LRLALGAGDADHAEREALKTRRAQVALSLVRSEEQLLQATSYASEPTVSRQRDTVDFCRLQPIMRVDGSGRIGVELLAGGMCCPEVTTHGWRDWYHRMADDFVGDLLDEFELLFINVSSNQIADTDIFLNLMQLPSPERIVLEWIEEPHNPTIQSDRVLKRLSQLRSLGFKLAVDDVGAGMDGIGRALQLRPDYAKLDGNLLHSCREGAMAGACQADLLLGMRIALQAVGCQVIAEWIETPADLELVSRSGIDLVQGRLYPTRVIPIPRRTQA
jgi:EAL domain-containing protein (putative c-di-GMP-specific phosphodiesterase class I)